MGTRTHEARGPRETPHSGADQSRWWGWRRTRSEPTLAVGQADEVSTFSIEMAAAEGPADKLDLSAIVEPDPQRY